MLTYSMFKGLFLHLSCVAVYTKSDTISSFKRICGRSISDYKHNIRVLNHCHGRNFVVKCGEDSLVWNQHSHKADAEVTFYIYRFQILYLEVFWEQR